MKPEFLRARILLIEDHPPTAATLQAILQALGFIKIMPATDMAGTEDNEPPSLLLKNKWIVPPKS
jgi:hypothetical protein